MRPAWHFAQRLCGRRAAVGVEVGVADGFNANVILQEWPELTLHLVEIDARYAPRIHERLAAWHAPERYTLHIDDSVDVAREFPDEFFDIVYLDDDHRDAAVTRGLRAWYRTLRIGGVLAGHDYDLAVEGDVKTAVDAFLAAEQLALTVEQWDWSAVRVDHGR